MDYRRLLTRLVVLAVVLATLGAGPAYAQWTYFDNNSDIRALYQDGNTLWIGTNGGVVLLDLSNTEIKGKIMAGPSLPGNSVRVIKSYEGDIYVGTDDGIAINPTGNYSVLSARDRMMFANNRDISWGVNGTTYFATYGHGVGVVGADRTFRVTREDSLLGNEVFAVTEVDTGRVYFATSLGLCAYRDSAWVGFQAGAGLPRGSIRQMIHVGEDRFYVLIPGRGVYRFNHSRSVRVRTGTVLGDDDPAVITLGADGSLWVGGRFGGIARYRRGEWTTYGGDDEDVSKASWRTAYTGPDGDVFFGSVDGLLAIVKDGNLRKVFVPSLLPSGYVGPITEDAGGRRYIVNGRHLLSSTARSDRFSLELEEGPILAVTPGPNGQVWVSTPWGMLRRSDDGWREVHPVIEIGDPRFTSLATDGSGNLWAGTHGGEVYRFDGVLWVAFARTHELSGGPVSRILIDGHRGVWAVTDLGGVHRYDNFGWTTYGLAEFDSLRIEDAAIDGTGHPTVVTARAVWRYDPDSGWRKMLTADPADIGRYRSVCFDAAGRLYLGTTHGLALVGVDVERYVDARDGLGGREVTALMVDGEDNLWVGFRDNGISRIALEDLW